MYIVVDIIDGTTQDNVVHIIVVTVPRRAKFDFYLDNDFAARRNPTAQGRRSRRHHPGPHNTHSRRRAPESEATSNQLGRYRDNF